MKITAEQIKHLAKLSRLDLKEEDIKKYQKDLSAILGYVSSLDKVKPAGGQASVQEPEFLREDKLEKFTEVDNLLQQAPEKIDRFIKVKNVK